MLTIDDKAYDTGQLSDAAREQIVNIQIVDERIRTAQRDAAIMHTARNAYATALQTELPKES